MNYSNLAGLAEEPNQCPICQRQVRSRLFVCAPCRRNIGELTGDPNLERQLGERDGWLAALIKAERNRRDRRNRMLRDGGFPARVSLEFVEV